MMRSKVVEVEITRRVGGHLVATWALEGAPAAVDVASGPTPNAIDHVHAQTVAEGASSLRIDNVPAGRVYVSVSPAEGGSAVVAAERLLPFQGAQNFRDLGGYQTADGRRVQWGQLFRSDALHALTPADLSLCGDLGFRTVYDLRLEPERTRAPSVPIPGVRTVLLPMGDHAEGAEQLMRRLRHGERAEDLLVEIYHDMIDRTASTFAELISQLADPDTRPALFHCAAGKDRTGLAAALLLSVLGVPDDDVLRDYELTPPYKGGDRTDDLQAVLDKYNLAPAVLAGLFGAPRQVMQEALDRIRSEYGGAERYLTDLGGMSAEAVTALRSTLLVANLERVGS